jgi:hypothetical protein
MPNRRRRIAHLSERPSDSRADERKGRGPALSSAAPGARAMRADAALADRRLSRAAGASDTTRCWALTAVPGAGWAAVGQQPRISMPRSRPVEREDGLNLSICSHFCDGANRDRTGDLLLAKRCCQHPESLGFLASIGVDGTHTTEAYGWTRRD